MSKRKCSDPVSPFARLQALDGLLEFYSVQCGAYEIDSLAAQPRFDAIAALAREANTSPAGYFTVAKRCTPRMLWRGLLETPNPVQLPRVPMFFLSIWTSNETMLTYARQHFSRRIQFRLLCCGAGGHELVRVLFAATPTYCAELLVTFLDRDVSPDTEPATRYQHVPPAVVERIQSAVSVVHELDNVSVFDEHYAGLHVQEPAAYQSWIALAIAYNVGNITKRFESLNVVPPQLLEPAARIGQWLDAALYTARPSLITSLLRLCHSLRGIAINRLSETTLATLDMPDSALHALVRYTSMSNSVVNHLLSRRSFARHIAAALTPYNTTDWAVFEWIMSYGDGTVISTIFDRFYTYMQTEGDQRMVASVNTLDASRWDATTLTHVIEVVRARVADSRYMLGGFDRNVASTISHASICAARVDDALAVRTLLPHIALRIVLACSSVDTVLEHTALFASTHVSSVLMHARMTPAALRVHLARETRLSFGDVLAISMNEELSVVVINAVADVNVLEYIADFLPVSTSSVFSALVTECRARPPADLARYLLKRLPARPDLIATLPYVTPDSPDTMCVDQACVDVLNAVEDDEARVALARDVVRSRFYAPVVV